MPLFFLSFPKWFSIRCRHLQVSLSNGGEPRFDFRRITALMPRSTRAVRGQSALNSGASDSGSVLPDPAPDAFQNRITLAERNEEMRVTEGPAARPLPQTGGCAPGLAGISWFTKAERSDDRPMSISQDRSGQVCSPLFETELSPNGNRPSLLTANTPGLAQGPRRPVLSNMNRHLKASKR